MIIFIMKKTIKIILGLVFIAVLIPVLLIAWATFTDYCPGPETIVSARPDAPYIPEAKTYHLLTWNLGYGGLSRDMDFFYDGGKQVRPCKNTVRQNIDAIKQLLADRTDVDFFLLQEVDRNSKRSYSINEVSEISGQFPEFKSFFAKNYDVFFVPVPVSDPLGHVLSGLLTLSRFEPVRVVRHSFPGNYSWPQGLFMLDRCFMTARYRLKSGKQFLVINTHNSAYDNGTLRKNQMKFLKNFLINEYQKGNYVLVGGDWNQCPPEFRPEFKRNRMDNENRMDINSNYLPGWTWAYDKTTPTNRRVKTPYDPETCLTTTIDFFLVSPNIKIKKVQGIHLDFEHSDHNPVKIEIQLN
jgi:endonuclease/exonuclease/phosphatase family metal-dependent hydrolase